ncbi:MAG: hypothetical protein KC621_15295 [Myxococcales bacterium]|nr:hypothetical protein [Myxococcales bacterium]
MPSLPRDVAWPVIDGSPGNFVAQLALAELPGGVLADIADRTASLVVFTNAEAMTGRALLVGGELRQRVPPAVPSMPLLHSEADEVLGAIVGDRSRPRWYLEVTDPDIHRSGTDDEDADREAEAGLRDGLAAMVKGSEPGYQPFDGSSARLVATMIRRRFDQWVVQGAPLTALQRELVMLEAETHEGRLSAAELVERLRGLSVSTDPVVV